MQLTLQRLILITSMVHAVGCAEKPQPAPKTEAAKLVAVEAQAIPTANGSGDAATRLKTPPAPNTPKDRFHGGAGAAGNLPAGHPPIPSKAGPMQPKTIQPAAEKDVALPLLLKGPGSADELSRRLASLDNTTTRKHVEEAFRLTFTVQRAQRQPQRAATLLAPLLQDSKAAATAERILGYVSVSSGFKVDEALAHYKRAIELEPDYGEAHYALGFIYAMNDRVQGEKHFQRALSLGVTDARNLARFYTKTTNQGEAQKGH